MKIFRYLTEDLEHIQGMLNETIANLSEWPQDRIFEQTKKALASLDEHFNKQKIISNNLADSENLDAARNEFVAQIKAIKQDIDSLIMIHVDEPGFAQVLQSMGSKVDRFLEFCKESFYPALLDNAPEADMKNIQTQLEEKALS